MEQSASFLIVAQNNVLLSCVIKPFVDSMKGITI